jgi:hypothetical protein
VGAHGKRPYSVLRSNDYCLLAERVINAGQGSVLVAMGGLRNEAVLGMIWLYLVPATYLR